MGATQDKLKMIISEYVDIAPDSIDINMNLQLDIGLDSFGLISLVCAIESEFNISIPDQELSGFTTLQDMAEYIYKQTQESI